MEFENEEFRTYRGYDLAYRREKSLTPSMEDYLEMIYRLYQQQGTARVSDLSRLLNVKPPSVTSMLQRLHEKGLVDYERYGNVFLTGQGKQVGAFLLKRHYMLEKFFYYLGVTQNLLENVERIEHNLTPEATRSLFYLVEYIEKHPGWFACFKSNLEKKIDW